MIGITLALHSSYSRTCLKLALCCTNTILAASYSTLPFSAERRLFLTKNTQQASTSTSTRYITQDAPIIMEKQKLATSLPNFFDSMSGLNPQEVTVFFEVLDEIVEDIGNFPFVNEATIANERVQNCIKYVLPSGLMSLNWIWVILVLHRRYVCGTIFLAADRFYAKQRQAKGIPLKNEEEHFRLTSVLGWGVHAYLVHAAAQDDILDGNHRRNNLESWHRLPGNAKHAIRDTELIKDMIFMLLKKYFRSKDFYTDLVDMMLECMYVSYIGISEMEIIKASTDIYNPRSANLLKPGKKYAYAVFPFQAIAVAMIVNGFSVADIYSHVREICLDMCLLAGISEDYIDGFGDQNVNERNTTDILEGKQTWLYWRALELASPAQAKLLMNSYGKYDEKCVETVKLIYTELKIKKDMDETIKGLEQDYETKISLTRPKLPDGPWPVLLDFMNYFRGVRAGKFSRP